MFARFLAIPFSVRLAVTLWLILIVAVSGRVLLVKPTSGTVVSIYLKAGERWAQGENLYAPIPDMDVYRNPPGFAAIFAPLADLNPRLVGIAWRIGCLSLFLVGLHRVRRAVFPNWSSARNGWLFCAAVLLALPAFNNGQVNLLLAATLLHAIADLLQERYWSAAAWLSLASWLKLYPVALALLAVLVFPRTLGWRLAVTLAIGAILPLLRGGPDYLLEQYRNFAHYLAIDDRRFAELSRVPLNWTIFPRVWLGIIIPAIWEKLVAVLAGGLIAGLIWRSRTWEPTKNVLLKVLMLGTTWMTVFGPATEGNTYSLWAGVAALGLIARPNGLAILGYALLSVTILRGVFPFDWRFQVLGPQPLGAICLAIGWLRTTTVASPSTVWSARIFLGAHRPSPASPATKVEDEAVSR